MFQWLAEATTLVSIKTTGCPARINSRARGSQHRILPAFHSGVRHEWQGHGGLQGAGIGGLQRGMEDCRGAGIGGLQRFMEDCRGADIEGLQRNMEDCRGAGTEGCRGTVHRKEGLLKGRNERMGTMQQGWTNTALGYNPLRIRMTPPPPPSSQHSWHPASQRRAPPHQCTYRGIGSHSKVTGGIAAAMVAGPVVCWAIRNSNIRQVSSNDCS